MAAPKIVGQVGDGIAHNARVVLEHNPPQVRVHSLVCTSPEVYSFLAAKRSRGQLETEFLRVVDVGVSVLRRVEIATDLDFVESRVLGLTDRFGHDLAALKSALLLELEKRFDPGQTGSYTELVNAFFNTKKEEFQRLAEQSLRSFASDQVSLKNALEAFARDLSVKLDPNQRGSFFCELVSCLEERFGRGGAVEELLNDRLSLDRDDSPLSRFLIRVERGITELRKEIVEYKAVMATRTAVAAVTPIKGRDLEEDVLTVLSRIARPFNGDYVEDVRNVSGPTGSKIGDFVYHLRTGDTKIVIEVRNEPLSSLPKALKTLDEAKANRGAQYGIYLAGEEPQLQQQVGQWSEFDGDRVISHFGLLEVAVKVGRACLTAKAAQRDGLDVTALMSELAAIGRAAKKLCTIKGEATGIQAASDRIHKLSDDLKAEIDSRLRAIDSAVSSADS
jgi:hypothetical protein